VNSRFMLALLATGVVALTGVAGRLAVADDAKTATCPVSGHPATIAADAPSTMVNGQTVYFCCADCPKAFAADPEKYVSKMSLKCPVMASNGAKADKKLRLAVNNGYMYFCCGGCPQAFLKSPEKFLTEAKDPVTGEKFKMAANQPHADYKGGHFYFANADNKSAFEKSPDKYAQVVGS
jgi:YHS domain-containing protein